MKENENWNKIFYRQFEVWEINLKEASVPVCYIESSLVKAFWMFLKFQFGLHEEKKGKMGERKLFEIGWLKKYIKIF